MARSTRRTYPAHDLADALCDTAHLIKTNVGTEVVSIDFGGWDMHANYGSNGDGEMHNMVGGLAKSLAAFMTDLGPLKHEGHARHHLRVRATRRRRTATGASTTAGAT